MAKKKIEETNKVNKVNKKDKKDSKKKSKSNKTTKNKQVIVDLTKMSLTKKLFVLREAIDFLALGTPVNQQVIDTCYDDLLNALLDYEFLQDEFDKVVYEKNNQPSQKSNIDDILDEIPAPELDENKVFEDATFQELIAVLYGNSYQKLQDGLDKLNQKYQTFYRVYFYPQFDGKSVKLKIFDDHDNTLKRVYDDKYDLDINLEQDIQSNFTKSKIELSKLKLSKKKEENIE